MNTNKSHSILHAVTALPMRQRSLSGLKATLNRRSRWRSVACAQDVSIRRRAVRLFQKWMGGSPFGRVSRHMPGQAACMPIRKAPCPRLPATRFLWRGVATPPDRPAGRSAGAGVHVAGGQHWRARAGQTNGAGQCTRLGQWGGLFFYTRLLPGAKHAAASRARPASAPALRNAVKRVGGETRRAARRRPPPRSLLELDAVAAAGGVLLRLEIVQAEPKLACEQARTAATQGG